MSTTKLAGADKMAAEIVRASAALGDLRPAYGEAANTVTSAQRSRAPRRSGALAASVRGRADDRAGYIETNLPYANAIHWGWRAHNIEPQPWLSMAAQASEPTWIGSFERLTDKALGMIKGLR